jgi:catechol 2,3-dioxygenase-like lactoylglutathione lyase family enzyme
VPGRHRPAAPAGGRLSTRDTTPGTTGGTSTPDPTAPATARSRIRDAHLRPGGERPASTARGLHHTALISSDVETTIRFYQDVLGFPLTELIENRDHPGSSHFFFDIGNGNLLAFFDFPGLDVGPYAEVLGGLHHVAISVEHVLLSGVSVYFRDPDGARIELIADPLGEMYGEHVL